MRHLFYEQVNGVMLVHDISSPKSWTALDNWATEVTGDGTFVAHFPNEVADQNLGGLPVPVLIVGNKADLGIGGFTPVGQWCRYV